MKFYTIPLNVGTQRAYASGNPVEAVQDNRLSTQWTGSTLTLHTDTDGDGTGTARTFDTVYAVCKGADSFTVSAFSGVTIAIADEMPDNIGNMLSVVDADGYHHILYSHPSKVSAATLTVIFSGNAEVAQIWMLDENKDVQISNDARFTQLDFNEVDRGATIRNSGNNVPYYIPGLGKQDLKTDIDCLCRFRPKNASYLHLKKFFSDNRQGFAVAVDYPAEPTLVGQYLVDPERPLRYMSSFKYSGKNYGFSLIHR